MRLRIETLAWTAGKPLLSMLRRKVFIEEQAVPESLEWDEHDSAALHFLVYTADNQAIATARQIEETPQRVRIGRFAVLPEYRGQRVGHCLLQQILKHARAEQRSCVVLSAQLSAQPFYQKAGFIAEGPVYLDAGIEHRTMSLWLTRKVD